MSRRYSAWATVPALVIAAFAAERAVAASSYDVSLAALVDDQSSSNFDLWIEDVVAQCALLLLGQVDLGVGNTHASIRVLPLYDAPEFLDLLLGAGQA